MSAVTAATDQSFAAAVLQSEQLVLVDYWADWCAPCRQLAPVVEALAVEYGDRAKFVKVDAQNNTLVPATYNVANLPTVQLFRRGQIVASLSGQVTRAKLRQMLDQEL
ncbi:MAG: thioredoxin [Propionibacteriaceae bacterium]|jgi:thioredoxin 1|nr:thioredoxin [Propionibacteriaceae bacterium]